jgi:predicted transcriptional regulator
MSPRAAWRLEQLGFTRVYDYVGGKADWLAAGLPTEGPGSMAPRPGAIARREVPTCRPDEPVAAARARLASSTCSRCVVVNDEHVVLGVLDQETLGGADDTTAAAVMKLGPTTVRAHEDLGPLVHRMHERRVGSVLVTEPGGRLLGLLVLDDGDRALSGETQQHA